MNNNQKILLFCGAAAIVFMMLYPPWLYVEPNQATHAMGYGWIWKPPVEKRSESADLFGLTLRVDLEPIKANELDWTKLLTQCSIAAIATFALICVTSSSQESGQRRAPTSTQKSPDKALQA